jgi:transketolase
MSALGGCFIGSSMSCVDLIVYIYNNFLNVNKDNLDSQERDYFFLSKGHAVPALYGTLAELKYFDESLLSTHTNINSNIYWHPNTSIPGIEFHFGSLGHGLPIAIGVALDCKIRGGSNKIVVIMGDGELNEGSVWESIMIGFAHKLDNLILIIDRNHLQANIETEKLIPLESIEKKFRSFHWDTAYIDGHDFLQIENALNNLPTDNHRPKVIIADTIRGKGIPRIERMPDKWFMNISKTEAEFMIEVLDNNNL